MYDGIVIGLYDNVDEYDGLPGFLRKITFPSDHSQLSLSSTELNNLYISIRNWLPQNFNILGCISSRSALFFEHLTCLLAAMLSSTNILSYDLTPSLWKKLA